MRRFTVLLGAFSATLFLTVLMATPAVAASGTATIYDSTVSPLPGNVPSEAFEATQTAEFGNQVSFAGTDRAVDSVVVTLSSWGCQNGHWYNDTCSTTPGSTFDEPITFTIYNVGATNAVGSVIASSTQTFAIPYRPSADNTHCTGADLGEWYDATSATCFNGEAVDVTFNFPDVVVPNAVIYGIAYNTSDYGYSPYGDATACHSSSGGCGYDSLNVGLSDEPPNPGVGSDPNLGTVYRNTLYAPLYCDNGAGGTGTFRIDGRPDSQNCASGDGGWSVNQPPTGPNDSPYYIPAVQFNVVVVSTCSTGTTCTATINAPSQTITTTGTKLATSSATISLSVAPQVLACPRFGYLAPVATLSDSGLVSGSDLVVRATVKHLPSARGVKVCYQPVTGSPPPPTFLKKCSHSVPAPCYISLKENRGSVIAKLKVPAGDPRFHIGGELPVVTKFSPASAAPGTKLTVTGVSLSEVTSVTIGQVAAKIDTRAATKLTVTVPTGAHSGAVVVVSQAGSATSKANFTVT